MSFKLTCDHCGAVIWNAITRTWPDQTVKDHHELQLIDSATRRPAGFRRLCDEHPAEIAALTAAGWSIVKHRHVGGQRRAIEERAAMSRKLRNNNIDLPGA